MTEKRSEFSESIRIGFKPEDMEMVGKIRAVCVALNLSDRDLYLKAGMNLIAENPEITDGRVLMTSRELIEYAYRTHKLHFSREHIYTYRKKHWKEGVDFFRVSRTGRPGYVFDRDAVLPFLKGQKQAARRYKEGREIGETEDQYIARHAKEAEKFEDDGPRVIAYQR